MGDFLFHGTIFVFVVLAGLLVAVVGFTSLMALWSSRFVSNREILDIAVKYNDLTWPQAVKFKREIDAAFDKIKHSEEPSLKETLAKAEAAERQDYGVYPYIDHEKPSAGLDLSEHNRMHKRW